jgi:hypothetical protein
LIERHVDLIGLSAQNAARSIDISAARMLGLNQARSRDSLHGSSPASKVIVFDATIGKGGRGEDQSEAKSAHHFQNSFC